MEWIKGILLGILQGITEFLPISSSGHLELAKALLGDEAMGEESMLMTVVLHFATALSTLVIFRKDIAEILSNLFNPEDKEARTFSIKIILSMIPAALVGILLEDQIEQLFGGSIAFVGAMLILTAGLLYWADKAKSTPKKVSYKDALLIGIAQAIAILPGISRSGATISTSVLLQIDRQRAARFSFLMVVPLIFGKMAKDIMDGAFQQQNIDIVYLSAGFIAAFITGIFACNWMIRLVKKSKLTYFALYCLVVGCLAIGASFIH